MATGTSILSIWDIQITLLASVSDINAGCIYGTYVHSATTTQPCQRTPCGTLGPGNNYWYIMHLVYLSHNYIQRHYRKEVQTTITLWHQLHHFKLQCGYRYFYVPPLGNQGRSTQEAVTGNSLCLYIHNTLRNGIIMCHRTRRWREKEKKCKRAGITPKPKWYISIIPLLCNTYSYNFPSDDDRITSSETTSHSQISLGKCVALDSA